MEKNDVESYQKIAEIITRINNLNNYRRARLTFDRISHSKNPVFKFQTSKKKESNNKIINEISITELPFIEKLNNFFINKLHQLSPKKDCKAELCKCNIKFDQDRKFLLMWNLIYYFFFPEEINNWEELKSEHLKGVLSYDFESLPNYKILLLQQIRALFSEIRDDFPSETILDKNGLNKCLFEKEHDTEILEVIWESKSQIKVADHIDQNIYRPVFGLESKKESFPNFRVDRVRCKRCNTEFFILREAIIEEKKNGIWDTIYSTFSQNASISYISKTNNLFYENWKALQELYEIHGLTENQAEVAAKLNFEIPLKHSTLRNTKQQLKKKLDNIDKILEIWDDLTWI